MELIFLDSLDSTNEYIKRNCGTLKDGSCVYTYDQTNGKGRRGRCWESEGKCLCMSVYIRKGDPLLIPTATAVGVARAMEAFGISTAIKWPNDIVAGGKKLCGILCEAAGDGFVAGIGINDLQTQEDLSRLGLPFATSVMLETGKRLPENAASIIAKEITDCLAISKQELIERFQKACINIGKEVLIITQNGEYRALAMGIDQNGGLIVKKDDGINTVISGEVSVRGIYGYTE